MLEYLEWSFLLPAGNAFSRPQKGAQLEGRSFMIFLDFQCPHSVCVGSCLDFRCPQPALRRILPYFSVLSRVFNDRFCEGQYLPITWKSPIKSKNSTDTVSQFLEFYRDVLCVKIEKKKTFFRTTWKSPIKSKKTTDTVRRFVGIL